jgi:UDP:flavonoid glycosyltransferase YjiC (YdhE family)
MNTVLTALSCAKPLVTIPITNEQPGIAARVKRSGAGRRLGLNQLSPSSLGRMIREVLKQPSYRARAQAQAQAQALQEDIARAGGVRRAAEIAEQVARTHQPVVA